MIRVDVLPAELLEQPDRGLLDELVLAVLPAPASRCRLRHVDVEVGDVDLAGDEAREKKVACSAKNGDAECRAVDSETHQRFAQPLRTPAERRWAERLPVRLQTPEASLPDRQIRLPDRIRYSTNSSVVVMA